MQIERSSINSNEKIAYNIWEMHFNSPQVANEYSGAGQFVSVLASDSWNHPLRRPMSIASVENGVISIIYKIFGDVTQSLSEMKAGDIVEIMGPLGNTFTNWKDNSYPVLVGGGVGLAPILNLRNECDANNIAHSIIIGARLGKEHFLAHEPDKEIYLTSDDGTIGEGGTVMGPLKRCIEDIHNPYIYACGPEPMLEAVSKFAIENGVPAQLSVESYMGCGIGICQGCVISRQNGKVKDHSYHQKYSLVCLDGPVYEAKDVHIG